MSTKPHTWIRLAILAGVAMLLLTSAWPAAAGLYPKQIVPEACSLKSVRANIESCTLCHIGVMAINLTNFLMFAVAIPLVGLLTAVAGIVMLTAGGSEQRITKGRNILINVIIGALIVFLAWLAVDTIIKVLTGQESFRGTFGPWHEINPQNCPLSGRLSGALSATAPVTAAPSPEAPKAAEPITVTPPLTPPKPTTAELGRQAKSLLDNYADSFSTKSDCGGGTHAQGTIQAMAAGLAPPVCSSSCSCTSGGATGKVSVDSRVLRLTERILREYKGKVEVTSLTTGRHGTDSPHYTGRAVDLQVKPGSGLSYRELEFTVRQALGGDTFLQCESGGARVDCRSPSRPIDHIHAQYNK